MRVLIVIVIALSVVTLVGVGYLIFESHTKTAEIKRSIGRLDERIASLEEKTATCEAKMSRVQESLLPSSEGEKSLAEHIETLNARIEGLDSRTERLVQTLKRAEETIGSGGASQVSGIPLDKDELKKLVKEAVSEQPRPIVGKTTIDAVAIRLNLNAVEKENLENILRSRKQEYMKVLLTPREDGSSLFDELADEFVTAIQTEGPPGAHKVFVKFFGRIMREKVPGMDKTYFEELERIKGETQDEIRELLGEERYEDYVALGINDPLDKIKIPKEPFEAYIMKKAQERGVVLPPPPQPRR